MHEDWKILGCYPKKKSWERVVKVQEHMSVSDMTSSSYRAVFTHSSLSWSGLLVFLFFFTFYLMKVSHVRLLGNTAGRHTEKRNCIQRNLKWPYLQFLNITRTHQKDHCTVLEPHETRRWTRKINVFKLVWLGLL